MTQLERLYQKKEQWRYVAIVTHVVSVGSLITSMGLYVIYKDFALWWLATYVVFGMGGLGCNSMYRNAVHRYYLQSLKSR